MEGHHTVSGITVNRTRYAPWNTISGMAKSPTVYEVLWENCLALMIHYNPAQEENLNWFARETKLGPGSVSRIKAKGTAIGLGVLVKIARRFGLQPWHLLMPDLDPGNPPVKFIADDEIKLYERLKKAHAVIVETQ